MKPALSSNLSTPPPQLIQPLHIKFQDVDMVYVLVSDMFAILSMSGCLAIIVCYIAFSGIRTTSRLLLVFLSIASLIGYASTLLESMTYYRTVTFPDERSFVCQTSAGLLVFSQICTALWTVAISFYLFLCVTVRVITIANRLVTLFHVFCWSMPFLVALCADLSGVYGYDSSDLVKYHHPTPCWISDRVSNALPWYLITVEGWVMAAYVIGSLLYFPVLWSTLRHKSKGKDVIGDDVIEDLGIVTANEQLRFIPVIYVCTRIWGTMYFLFTRYPEDRHLRGYDWLLILKAIGNNSQGLVNAIFFCTATRHIRKVFALKLCRFFACCSSWCGEHRVIGSERWMRVPQIVRPRGLMKMQTRRRTLDGSDLDISGISLDLPEMPEDMTNADEDEVLFER